MDKKQELKYCEVDALRITSIGNGKIIYFICPFCSVYLKKNGSPYVKPKIREHYHGMTDCEYKQGYIKDRFTHCLNGKFPDDKFSSFKIIVTDETKLN